MHMHERRGGSIVPWERRRRDGAGGGGSRAASGAQGELSAWSCAGRGPRRRGAGPGRAEVSGPRAGAGGGAAGAAGAGGRCGASAGPWAGAGAGLPRVRRDLGQSARAHGRPSPKPLLRRPEAWPAPEGCAGGCPGLADLTPRRPLRAVDGGLTSGRARPTSREREPAEVRSGPATLTFHPQPRVGGFTPFQTGRTEAQAGGCPAPPECPTQDPYDLLPLP